tara:strand:+ start:277 stop:2880 length:2604 start_codon:yes stop_codon:yes gene_type:complete
MTSSFQSTAFQSSARPVDTFVRPPSVQPKTDIEFLAETLVTINPNLQKFIGTKIDKAVEDERKKGTKIALDAAKNSGEIKDIRKQIANSNGDEFANGLIGGSIFANDQFNKDITTLLGDEFTNQALSLFENKKIKTLTKNGKEVEVPLSHFSIDSRQFQDFLGELNTLGGNLTQGLDENYILENFYPKQSKTLEKIITDHAKNHNLYKFNNLKKLSFSNISSAYVDYQNGNKEEAITKINNFINDKVLLGITQDKTEKFFDALLNYTISLRDEAFNIDGLEGSKNVFEMMRGIKYGPNGASIFETHPEFLSKMHEQTIKHRKNLEEIEKINNQNKKNEVENLLLQAVLDLGTEEGDLPFVNKNFDAVERLRQFGVKYGVSTDWLDNKINIFQPQRIQTLQDFSLQVSKGQYLGQPNKGITDLGIILNSLGTLTKQEKSILNIIRTQLESSRKGQLDGSNQTIEKIKLRIRKRAGNYNSTEEIWVILENDKDPTNFILNLERDFENDFIKWAKYTDENNDGVFEVRTELEIFNYLNDKEKELELKLQNWKEGDDELPNNNDNKENNTNTNDVITIDTDIFNAMSQSENYEEIIIDGEKILRNKNNNKKYKMNPEVNSTDFQGDPLNKNRNKNISKTINTDGFEASAFSGVDSPTTVTVQPGDTLSQLAEEFGIPLKDLMKANNITNADLIEAGRELIVPIVKVVTPNETKIETKNKLPEVELNKLKEEIKIRVDNQQPLTKQQINKLLLNAGFTQEQARIMTAIAMAESLNKVDAFYGGTEKNPEESYGLFQINMYNYKDMELGNDRRPKLGINNNEALYDPVLNAIAAKLVFDETQAQKGNGYLAWGVYSKDGKTEAPNARYKDFLD